ncbi:MAG: prepilin-type N-terminal cleavage/methylation domain-containing protein [Oscillospiraceae bacterium]|nr:prepilin-type N-terminal cleavage/methylation domain-containing protein [Oscillospiraceae bacterium]
MKARKTNQSTRRGISIVEVTIALVIISILSIAALSMIKISVNVEKKAMITMEVSNAAENAVECFRYAETTEEFFECLQMTGAYKEEDGAFTFSGETYTVTFHPEGNQLTCTAVNEDGEEIYAFTFRKGGGAE